MAHINLLVVLFAALLCTASVNALFENGDILEAYSLKAQSELKSLLTVGAKTQTDIEAVYQNAYIVFANSPNSALLSAQQQCQHLQRFEPTNSKQAYYFIKLGQLLTQSGSSCRLNADKTQLENILDVSSNNDNFEHFYHSLASKVALASSPAEKEELAEYCPHLREFLVDDGSVRSSSKEDSGQYTGASGLYEIFEGCLRWRNSTSFTNKFLPALKVAVQSVFLNAQEVKSDEWAVLERGQSIQATASLTRSLHSLFEHHEQHFRDAATNFRRTYQLRFLKYVRSAAAQSLDTLTLEQRYEIASLAHELRDFSIVVIREQPILGTRARVELPFRFENLLGRKISASHETLLPQAKLLHREQPVTDVEIKAQANEAKNSEWSHIFAFDSSSLQKPLIGFYILRIERRRAAGEQALFVQNERVNFVTKATPTKIEFEVLKGRGIPSQFAHNLLYDAHDTHHNQHLQSLALTENSFLAVRFTLEWEKNIQIVPNQAGIILRHPNYEHVTTFVQAHYNSDGNDWTAIIDLGDPEQILPYSATYDAELLVADQKLKDNVRWTFAKFAIKFKKSRTQLPPSELDYTVPQAIAHTFPPPLKEPPIFFISIYLILIVASFYAFITLLKTLNVNLNRIPTTFNEQILVYIFLAGLAILFGILLLFWLKINLIQTLWVLAAYAIPFFLVGNFALGSIKKIEND